MSVVSLPKKPARRDEPPIGADLAQLIGGQERVAADVVDLVEAVGAVAQDHVGGGAGRRRRIAWGAGDRLEAERLGDQDVRVGKLAEIAYVFVERVVGEQKAITKIAHV